MRLLSLQFAAIGPFAGSESIDFTRLSRSGIFLFEGPTGSGKSTIIDAIVFALYGVIADSDNKAKERLRSDFAAVNQESFVDLVFETNQGVFRVRRTPSYERPKQRGTGTTTHNATAQLWRLSTADLDLVEQLNAQQPPGSHDDLDARGELISHRANEVGGLIEQFIGLDRRQFVQTVVLPQGLFAQFLTAKAEDRSTLLRKIFRTDLYVHIEKTLRTLASEKTTQVRQAEQQVAHTRDNLTAILDESEPTEVFAALRDAIRPVDANSSSANNLTLVAQSARQAQQNADQLLERAHATWQQAKNDADSARQKLDNSKNLVNLQQRRDKARARLAELDDQRELVNQQRTQVAQADRALLVLKAAQRYDEAREQLASTQQPLTQAHNHVRELGIEVSEPLNHLAIQTHHNELSHSLERARDLEKRLEALTALAESQRKVDDQFTALVAQQAKTRDRCQAHQQRIDELTAATATVGQDEQINRDATSRANALSSLYDSSRSLHTVVMDWYNKVVDLVDATAEATSRIDNLSELQRERLVNIAGELARDLKPGQPCPVCGGTEHPNPAHTANQAVTEAAIEAAEADRKKAFAKTQEVRDQVQELKHRYGTLIAQFTEFAAHEDVQKLCAQLDADSGALVAGESDANLRHRLGEVTQALSQQIADAQHTADLEVSTSAQILETHRKNLDELETLRTKLANNTTQLQQVEVELSAVRAQREQISQQRQRDHSQTISDLRALVGSTPAELSDDVDTADANDCVTAFALHVDNQMQALTDLARLFDDYDRARMDADHRREILADTLTQQGFEDVAAANAASLTPNMVTHLSDQIKQYDEDLARTTAIMQLPEIAALPDDLVIDLNADQLRYDEALAAEQVAHDEHTARVRMSEKISTAAAQLLTAISDYEQLAASSQTLVRLAGLVGASSPDNRKRMSLSTYVLVQRFESVIAAANQRLGPLSYGRYRLERAEERENNREQRLGLALHIVDNATQKARPTRSLSGGETFYVSLCLALGLADVVTSESAARDLGTLIIDEGFGTLDAEKLDAVIQELSALHTAGRTIGVVSHVAELKQIIAEQIRITPRKDGGSSLHVVA